jgi:type II secretory pathway component PulJ
MKFFTVIKREDGFTIQEVLVVLIVGSILVGLSLSLFLFTNKLFLTWSGTNDLKSETNRILYQMAFDIQQAREIVENTDTSFVLSKSVGRVVRYSYNGKTLQRNDVEMTPRKAATIRVKVVEEHTLGGSLDRAPLFHISVLVQSTLLDYTAEIDAAPAPSSRSLFIQSQIHQ